MMLDLKAAPEIGFILTAAKQRYAPEQKYEVVQVTPYTRKDGGASSLVVWRSACPVCGAPFEVTTGLVSKGLARRCMDHRSGNWALARKGQAGGSK